MVPKLLMIAALAAFCAGGLHLYRGGNLSFLPFSSSGEDREGASGGLTNLNLQTYREFEEVSPKEIVAFTTTPNRVTILKFYSEK